MMAKLLKIANKNIMFKLTVYAFIWLIMGLINIANEGGRFLRKIGFGAKKYKKIKSLKDKYKGERCFIICTGPSLTLDDLNKLKKEYSFGMNSISLLYDKTDFRPSFFGCIDEGVFVKLRDSILKYDSSNIPVFISGRAAKHCALRQHWYEIPINVAYHTYDRWVKNKFWCKFSDDAYAGLYDMYSVTHVLIQLAVYMGFKKIYLIGCDCNQEKGKQVHFKDYGVPDAAIDTARERNINGFEAVKEYCDTHDVNVYNATRGGMLEVFERVKLEDLF
ncbi:MAG: DUF115 domain-containing protein [Coprococcus sp.]|nr:DUF115 domain-containing protein [Coprococcus sp.]